MVEELKKEDWRLESIKLEFITYGEDKGKYNGRITFQNGKYESFSFRIRPDMADAYIRLIAADLVLGAENLGSRLLESLRKQGLIDAED